jgi:hypothetical protein
LDRRKVKAVLDGLECLFTLSRGTSLYVHMSEWRDEGNKHTNLDTDGTNNADLIAITHVFRCEVFFRVPTVEFRLAVCGDNRLRG